MHCTLCEEPLAVPKPRAGEGTAVGVGPRGTDKGASPNVAAKLVGCWKLDVARRRADER